MANPSTLNYFKKSPYLRNSLIVIGVFTFFAILNFIQFAIFMSSVGHEGKDFPPIYKIILSIMRDWYIWAILIPLIYWLFRRFPIRADHWIPDIILNVFVGIAFLLFKAFLDAVLSFWFSPFPIREETILDQIFHTLLSPHIYGNLILFGAILSVMYSMEYYKRFRERELLSVKLEAELAASQLLLLKNQIQPHFLFNTLNAISSLIYQDTHKADEMIVLLSDLLRYSLSNLEVNEIPLKEEIKCLKKYLEIEKIRFEDHLLIEYQISPDTLEIPVPTMLLQPLVENSIRHGIAKRAAVGKISIQTYNDSEFLHIFIQDDGPGLSVEQRQTLTEGIGLANVRQRIKRLYGYANGYVLTEAPNGGLCVQVRIPLTKNHDDEL